MVAIRQNALDHTNLTEVADASGEKIATCPVVRFDHRRKPAKILSIKAGPIALAPYENL
jgi:hypothetical protein